MTAKAPTPLPKNAVKPPPPPPPPKRVLVEDITLKDVVKFLKRNLRIK